MKKQEKTLSTKRFKEAVRFHHERKWPEAIRLYREIIAQDARHSNAWGNLGSALKAVGELDEAELCLKRAAGLDPADYNHPYNLGNTLRELKRPAEAISAYRSSIALNPRFPWSHYNLGLTFDELGRADEAKAAYVEALRSDPRHYDANLNLGALLEGEGLLSEATSHYRAAIEAEPDRAPAYNNLALALQNAGRPAEGLEVARQALQKEPHQHRIASNALMTLQYTPGVTDGELLETARTFGQRFPEPVRLPPPLLTERKLRIGYVSADLCAHPVGLFLRHVLEHHDRERFDICCYSNGARRDEVSDALAAHSQWRDIRSMDNEALLRQIRADGIDILVDLSGHTAGNRLPVFACPAAPVQISWLGYFATTGMPAMDFVILDPWHAPAGAEAQFCERIIRLPHNRFCYRPADFAPLVSSPPFEKTGFITFGSFNSTAKLNETVLDTWARILNAVPDSRLILKWRTFADAPFRQRIADFYAARGVDSERLELREVSSHQQLLREYADIDIALDPFPFSGGHTSCEALWMGVPVVTLPQARVVSRQTWSFLNNIGLPGLAAADVPGYVQLAMNLANSPDTLLDLRQSLREKMRASPLCDATGFTRLLEEAYRVAWQEVSGQITNRPEQSLSPAMRAEQLHQASLQAWQQGDGATARRNLEEAIALNPDVAAYHANIGVMLKQTGAGAERIACYQRAIELAPEEALYHANLAGALNENQQYGAGELAARQSVAIDPKRDEGWFNLGSSLMAQGRWCEAASAYDQAAECKPGWLEPIKLAGEAYSKGGEWGEAARRLQKALLGLPEDATATHRVHLLRRLGQTQRELYLRKEAEGSFREALGLAPDDVELLTDLGNALKGQGKYDEARKHYQHVLDLDPQLSGAWCNRGTVEQSLGNYEAAIDCYRKDIAIVPTLGPVWSNLGACLTYSPNHGPADVLAAYRGFDEHMARPLFDPRPRGNGRDPERRLRVGYVSPDFRDHAVAYFALPLIEGHSKEQVEVFCYHNHPQNDAWTERFKTRADHWSNCVNMSDEDLAERIRADGIDILVDLAGHTESNRLLTFARKPAPVQVTWMGYVTTTGMSAMDWRVTHADADPEGAEAHYSEKLWRLPGTMWCYRPLPGMPEVTPTPLLKTGYVTFGSFNRYSKSSPLVLETWAAILNRVPDSRLLICVPEGSIREQMARFFAERGINPERISGFAKVSHEDFWKLHGEVDIALDPFPFGGGTTTCETLWLGVPLVTCTGKAGGDFAPRFASRMGQAFLRNIGLPDLVAETLPQYVDIAVQLAQDAPRMAQLRQSLRPLMAAAPLTDEVRFVREMEEAYRAMWREWCAQPNEPSNH